MEAATVRTLISKVLLTHRKPLTSERIAELLRFKYHVHVSTVSVGANLGYLRASGVVDRRPAPIWGRPYYRNGKWHFSTENWWYHTAAVTEGTIRRFIQKIRLDVEAKARDNQRTKGRPVTNRLPARSDDMRQMVIDIERQRWAA